jgi:DNA repair photolyase
LVDDPPEQRPIAIRGRGAASNPPNRFERLARIDDEPDAPATELYRDTSRTIIATNDSPDVGFSASINPYRGCETGCGYCYARPTHEYLGLSAGLDFETKIFVKEDAAELLKRELADPRWQPQTLSMSGVTDPYQPVERRLQITRQCLEVLVEFRNPVCFVTKSHLITRDADLIGELARFDAAGAILSITTLDRDLARRLEPRAATPDLRLDALRCLSEAGVPTGVMVAPIIPGLTDHEVPAILAAAADAGARVAGYTIVRLPLAVAPLFEAWLDAHAPGRKQKVLNRLRAMRGGRLNDPRMGKRMRGEGAFAVQIDQLFRLGLKRAGLTTNFPSLSTAHFRRPGQLALFE